MMDLLAVVPYGGGNRAHFQLTPSEVRKLPIPLRNAMIEKLAEWRAQEDSSLKGK